jgi:DNA-binding NarL/FixJ family response regulator
MKAAEPAKPQEDKSPIAVAIVEDNAEFRHQLIQFIDGAPGFRCTCACASAEEALRLIPESAPDVVLMDIQLPRMNGIACTASLREKLPSVPVMMLTVYEDTDAIFDALKAGAKGYLLKRSDPTTLLESIRELHQGGAPMTSQIARKVINSFHHVKPPEHPQDKLTDREQEILDLLAAGHATREVANKLSLSYKTVRWHLRHIYDKLHVHTRTEAVLRRLG